MPWHGIIQQAVEHRHPSQEYAADRWAAIERWAREQFPGTGPVQYRWSGQILEPVDGLAFIGPNPGVVPNIYVATGDSGPFAR